MRFDLFLGLLIDLLLLQVLETIQDFSRSNHGFFHLKSLVSILHPLATYDLSCSVHPSIAQTYRLFCFSRRTQTLRHLEIH